MYINVWNCTQNPLINDDNDYYFIKWWWRHYVIKSTPYMYEKMRIRAGDFNIRQKYGNLLFLSLTLFWFSQSELFFFSQFERNYSYVVALHITLDDNSPSGCTGALIALDTVITAAHCVCRARSIQVRNLVIQNSLTPHDMMSVHATWSNVLSCAVMFDYYDIVIWMFLGLPFLKLWF